MDLLGKGINYNAHTKILGLFLFDFRKYDSIYNCKLAHHLFDFLFGLGKNRKLLIFIVNCKYFVLDFD